MALSPVQMKQYYNDCNPYQPLEPGDRRNVIIDGQVDDELAVRGGSWAAKLAIEVELANRPVCLLCSGLRGSGKSTELRRLAAQLADDSPARANLLPVLIDAEEVLDLTAAVDVPDLLMAMLYETERAVLREEKRAEDEAMREGAFERLWGAVMRMSVESVKVEWGAGAEGSIAVPGVGAKGTASSKVVAELKVSPSLRKQVRDAVAKSLSTFLGQVEQEFRKLEQRAVATGRSGVVVIVDSLEKLQGTSETFEEVLSSVEKIFANGAPYLRLPVSVIYTVPPPMLVRMPTDSVRFLPMIKLRTWDREPAEGAVVTRGKPFLAGVAVAREIVRRRVPDSALGEFLGPDFEGRLREIIDWSGGYPRELMRLLQRVMTAGRFPLTDLLFRRTLSQAADENSRIVFSNGQRALEMLAKVYLTQKLTIDLGEHTLADRLLTGNLILRYSNDKEWDDIHPALLGLPQLREAVERQQAALLATRASTPPPAHAGPAPE
jgi:hypothetical protein